MQHRLADNQRMQHACAPRPQPRGARQALLYKDQWQVRLVTCVPCPAALM